MANGDHPKPLSPETVEEQLAQILASPQFASSERLSSFLAYVVRKTLAAKGEDIKEYAVGTEVFKRPESFDPRLDTIVRVQASKLRSRLAEYYSQSGANDKVTIELRRGSYVPAFYLNGTATTEKTAARSEPVGASATDQPRQRGLRYWMVPSLAAAGAIALMSAYQLHRANPTSQPQVMRFAVSPPDGMDFFGSPEISPDGSHVLGSVHTQNGGTALWMRSLDAPSGQVLPDTEGGMLAGWSADGRLGLFCTPDNVAAIDVAHSGPPRKMPAKCSFGMDWNKDGVIIQGDHGYPIRRVSAANGTQWNVTQLDSSRDEIGHYWPQFLPDNKHFLYFARSRRYSENAIYVGSVDGGTSKRLVKSESLARYAPASHDLSHPGYLLYMRGRTLVAQSFDPKKLEVSGDPMPVTRDVAQTPYGFATFSVSRAGTLVYLSDPGWNSQLTWFDGEGHMLGTLGPAGKYGDPVISPDGKRVAFDVDEGPNRDIGVIDIAGGQFTRLTFNPEVDHGPVWSPDGTRIAFDSHRSGMGDLFVKESIGAGEEQRLLAWTTKGIGTNAWSSDGKFLAFTTHSSKTAADIWILPLGAGQKPFPYLETEASEDDATFAPDGRWVAYTSDESGRPEVYVQSFDGTSAAGGGKWQISTSGGSQPAWRGNGNEIFYLTPENVLMAAEVNTHKAFEIRSRKKLFDTGLRFRRGPRNEYAVNPEGTRFLVRMPAHRVPAAPINVFVNWPATLKY